MNLSASLVAEQARILARGCSRDDHSRPALAQFLLNWHYAASGSETRIRKVSDQSVDQALFVATGEGQSQVFAELGRGWGYGSLLGRGKDLAASYGLDEVSWAPSPPCPVLTRCSRRISWNCLMRFIRMGSK